jgi:hypothetical protein
LQPISFRGVYPRPFAVPAWQPPMRRFSVLQCPKLAVYRSLLRAGVF